MVFRYIFHSRARCGFISSVTPSSLPRKIFSSKGIESLVVYTCDETKLYFSLDFVTLQSRFVTHNGCQARAPGFWPNGTARMMRSRGA